MRGATAPENMKLRPLLMQHPLTVYLTVIVLVSKNSKMAAALFTSGRPPTYVSWPSWPFWPSCHVGTPTSDGYAGLLLLPFAVVEQNVLGSSSDTRALPSFVAATSEPTNDVWYLVSAGATSFKHSSALFPFSSSKSKYEKAKNLITLSANGSRVRASMRVKMKVASFTPSVMSTSRPPKLIWPNSSFLPRPLYNRSPVFAVNDVWFAAGL